MDYVLDKMSILYYHLRNVQMFFSEITIHLFRTDSTFYKTLRDALQENKRSAEGFNGIFRYKKK